MTCYECEHSTWCLFHDGDAEENVDDILERWLNGEDVSDFEDDGAVALTKEEYLDDDSA